jgi:hypothetical protein
MIIKRIYTASLTAVAHAGKILPCRLTKDESDVTISGPTRDIG